MSHFKGRRFPTELILLCVRWYCKYGVSYRGLEEMMRERGVAVEWAYLYRALDKHGQIIDFMLSPRRTAKSARRFLAKALRLREDCPPSTINTDQNEAYGKAIRALKRAGELDNGVQHRQIKYLNNRLEANHGALKRPINPTRGFKTLPTASVTIKGFEVIHMIRKRQCLMLEPGTTGEVRFVNRLFRLAA
jgi:IS6 family transposase